MIVIRQVISSSINLCISEFDRFFFFIHLALAGLASLLSLRVLLRFKTTSTSSKAGVFNFYRLVFLNFHRLVFCVKA